MAFEEQNSEPLINQKESTELKTGEIERIYDDVISSYADVKTFLEEQVAQARELLAKKADALKGNIDPQVVAQALQEAHNKITESIDVAFRELSIASVRASCSQLSDIVGFELEIDENGLDQFGLEQRLTLRDAMHGIGFQNYKGEKIKTGEKVTGALEFVELREQMRKLDTPMTEVQAVMDDMRLFGEVEYRAFSSTGPVLVVVPELHHDAGILRDNFDLLLKIKRSIALLASEGAEGEVTQEMIEGPGTSTQENYLSKIADYDVAISTVAVEDVLGNDVRTLGVEKLGTLSYILREVQRRMQNLMIGFESNPQLTARMEELTTQMVGGSMTKADALTYQAELASLFSEGFNRMAIFYRNQIWLNAVSRELLENQDALSANNNLVVLVCGAAHADDLLGQAEHYGFKGAVRFMPNSFKAPIDMQTASVYMQKQMGMSSQERSSESSEATHKNSPDEIDELVEYRSKLESVLAQSAYSYDFKHYAYSYLIKQGIESAQIDQYISGDARPNLLIIEIAIGHASKSQPIAEGSAKTRMESALSLVFAEFIKEARSEGNENFEGIIGLIRNEVGLEITV